MATKRQLESDCPETTPENGHEKKLKSDNGVSSTVECKYVYIDFQLKPHPVC